MTLDQETFNVSARPILEETIDDPLLIEMLLCPLMWYGNAREHDMDWGCVHALCSAASFLKALPAHRPACG